jgi:hypothetical protein
MIVMKFIKKIPASIFGVGGPYQPGQEVSLPDEVAKGLIATKDADWEQLPARSSNSHEGSPHSGSGSSNKRR